MAVDCQTCDKMFVNNNFFIMCRCCGKEMKHLQQLQSHFMVIKDQVKMTCESLNNDNNSIKQEQPHNQPINDQQQQTPIINDTTEGPINDFTEIPNMDIIDNTTTNDKSMDESNSLNSSQNNQNNFNHQSWFTQDDSSPTNSQLPTPSFSNNLNDDDSLKLDADDVSVLIKEDNDENDETSKDLLSQYTERKKPEYFVCCTCGKREISNSALHLHLKSEDMCDICGEVMRHERIRPHKVQAHQASERIDCHECGKSFKPKNFNWHVKRIHNKDFTYHYCKFCDYKSPDAYKIKIHTKYKHDENAKKDFLCLICGFEAHLKGTLKPHIINRHGPQFWEEWQNYDWSKHDYENHQFQELPPPKRKKRSSKSNDQDDYSNDGETKVKKHSNVEKRTQETAMCDICGKIFVSKTNCIWHYKRVHTKDLKLYHCEICEYKSPDKFKIKQHTKLMHETNAKKEFVCHVCGKEMSLKGNLKAHVKSVHGEEFWDSWRKN